MNLRIVSLFALVAEVCVFLSCELPELPDQPPVILHGVWPYRTTGRSCGLFVHSVRSVHPGRFPRAEGQGRTIKGAVAFLAQLSLFNLTDKISALLAESLPKAYNNHHLLTSYHSQAVVRLDM